MIPGNFLFTPKEACVCVHRAFTNSVIVRDLLRCLKYYKSRKMPRYIPKYACTHTRTHARTHANTCAQTIAGESEGSIDLFNRVNKTDARTLPVCPRNPTCPWYVIKGIRANRSSWGACVCVCLRMCAFVRFVA